MSFDINKLSTPDRLIVGGGAVAFIAAFLPWWGYSGPLRLYSTSVIGWSAGFTAWLGSLLLTAAAVYLVLRRSDVSLPTLPFGPAFSVAGASVIGLALVIIRWVSLPRVRGGLAGSIGPKFGIWLAIIGAIVELVGAAMEFRSSGESLPWAETK
jgi:hypothetical protein